MNIGAIGWDGDHFHVFPAAEEYASRLHGLLGNCHFPDPESGSFITSTAGDRWFRL